MAHLIFIEDVKKLDPFVLYEKFKKWVEAYASPIDHTSVHIGKFRHDTQVKICFSINEGNGEEFKDYCRKDTTVYMSTLAKFIKDQNNIRKFYLLVDYVKEEHVYDFKYNEIKVGSEIVYPTLRGHTISMKSARVGKIKEGKSGPVLVCEKDKWGKAACVRKLSTVIVTKDK